MKQNGDRLDKTVTHAAFPPSHISTLLSHVMLTEQ